MLVGVLLFLGEKRNGVLAPVAAGVEVVRGVVAVVEAVAVALVDMLALNRLGGAEGTYGNVDDSDAGAEVRVRLDLVDKRVLCPVPNHHAEAHNGERNQEHETRSPRIHEGEHAIQEQVVSNLETACLEREIGLPRAKKVPRQIEPAEEVEAAHIVQEMPDIIPLVAHGGAQIVWSVGFDVVVLDVVEVVRVPGMAHERIRDIREHRIEERVCLAQDSTHVNVLVHHQCVRPHVVYLHGGMQRTVPPVEVVEHVDRRGDAREEVEEKMCDHGDVGVDADDGARPSDVGIEYVFAEERILDIGVVVRHEDGGLEGGRGRVVEGFHVREGLVFDFLKIWSYELQSGQLSKGKDNLPSGDAESNRVCFTSSSSSSEDASRGLRAVPAFCCRS